MTVSEESFQVLLPLLARLVQLSLLLVVERVDAGKLVLESRRVLLVPITGLIELGLAPVSLLLLFHRSKYLNLNLIIK